MPSSVPSSRGTSFPTQPFSRSANLGLGLALRGRPELRPLALLPLRDECSGDARGAYRCFRVSGVAFAPVRGLGMRDSPSGDALLHVPSPSSSQRRKSNDVEFRRIIILLPHGISNCRRTFFGLTQRAAEGKWPKKGHCCLAVTALDFMNANVHFVSPSASTVRHVKIFGHFS